jgi:hypothetical protein
MKNKLILSVSDNLVITKQLLQSIRQPFITNKVKLSEFYAKNARRGRQIRVVQVVCK